MQSLHIQSLAEVGQKYPTLRKYLRAYVIFLLGISPATCFICTTEISVCNRIAKAECMEARYSFPISLGGFRDN